MEMLAASSGGWIGTQTNHSLNFQTNNTERMRIDSSGRVGIGTSSPAYKFHQHESSSSENYHLFTNSTTGSTSSDGFRIGIDSNENALIWHRENNSVQFATNNTERMRIDSSGRVGIGTSSPSGSGLHIKKDTASTTNELLRLSNSAGSTTDGVKLVMEVANTSGNGGEIGTVRDGGSFNPYMYFSTSAGVGSSPSERMRLDSSGYLLVGTTTTFPGANNTASGSMIQDNGSAYFSRATGYALGVNRNTTDGTIINIAKDGTTVGSISVTASATAYNTSSDYRLKTDAQPMTGASARVQALNPVNFEWIADGTRVDGFLAHEAQEVVPEAVTGTKDAMRDEEYEVTPAVLDDDGNVVTEAVMGTRSVPDYQGIDQSKLVPLLTAALQEALTKIDALETRITALEG